MPGQPGPVLVAGYVLYGGTLALSLGWTAWSIHRHGVWKRSTRRYSYYFYALLCAVRLAWLGTLARSPVDGTLSVDEFLSPGVSGLNRLALCLGHNAFSMVIFGWANVTAISYRSSAPMLTARRAFVGLNTINWAAHAGLYAAVHLAGFGRDADGGDARLAALTCLSVALLVAFAVVLTIAAAVFGMVLSMKFVQLAAAAADPTLGTYVSVKFNKINVAWHVFCVCFALRALCLGSSLPLGFEVHPAHYLLFGYYLPGARARRARRPARGCHAHAARAWLSRRGRRAVCPQTSSPSWSRSSCCARSRCRSGSRRAARRAARRPRSRRAANYTSSSCSRRRSLRQRGRTSRRAPAHTTPPTAPASRHRAPSSLTE